MQHVGCRCDHKDCLGAGKLYKPGKILDPGETSIEQRPTEDLFAVLHSGHWPCARLRRF